MKNTTTLLALAATVVFVVPALAAEHSAGEIAWGKRAVACINKPEWKESGAVVVEHPKSGKLVIWSPNTADGVAARDACQHEASAGDTPKTWDPPADK